MKLLLAMSSRCKLATYLEYHCIPTYQCWIVVSQLLRLYRQWLLDFLPMHS